MRRVLVCYNPRASHHEAVEAEVLAATRGLRGYMVGRYAIKPTNFNDNAKQVARLVNDGDLVIVAGGDGSAAIAVNGILDSGKDVTLGVLGYGNFNDIARMLGVPRKDTTLASDNSDTGDVLMSGGVAEILARFEAGKTQEIYPLDILVNGEHWRYAPSYMTIGMFAQSTEVFDNAKVREQLQTGKKSRSYSVWQLAKWYFRQGKRSRLPAGSLNGTEWPKNTTDYIAVNGITMAGMMKGGDWYLSQREFLSTTARLGSLVRLVRFMLASMHKQVPGVVSVGDTLFFAEPSAIELHAEGEYERMAGVSQVEVKKNGKSLRVVSRQ